MPNTHAKIGIAIIGMAIHGNKQVIGEAVHGAGINEQEPNEATEIVGGKVETVEVSVHPEASIPETDLSLADIERRRSHPLRWALIILAVLCAIIAPYWFGRSLAVNNTDSIVAVLGECLRKVSHWSVGWPW